MKIRDGFATLNGGKTEHTMDSGSLEIIADDGRPLFHITLEKNGAISVSGGMCCKHGDTILDDSIILSPVASNLVRIWRPEYK